LGTRNACGCEGRSSFACRVSFPCCCALARGGACGIVGKSGALNGCGRRSNSGDDDDDDGDENNDDDDVDDVDFDYSDDGEDRKNRNSKHSIHGDEGGNVSDINYKSIPRKRKRGVCER